MDLHEVELISLAACSIGVGQSTGPVNPESLVRALLDAGARRVIAAGWEIESQSAGAMFTGFYGKVAGGRALLMRCAPPVCESFPTSNGPSLLLGGLSVVRLGELSRANLNHLVSRSQKRCYVFHDARSGRHWGR